MMIGIYEEQVNQIPYLHIVKSENYNIELPTIIYFHGFTSAKEQNLPIAYMLAQKGFRVLLPESLYHGERSNGLTDKQLQMSFWNIVIQNVQDLEELRSVLLENNWLLEDKLGIAGTSMGGITTSAALAKYNWVRAAAIMMGSPKITDYANALIGNFKKYGELPISDNQLQQLLTEIEAMDLSRHVNTLDQRPVMFWHGDKDPVVPFEHSFLFYQEVKDTYLDQQNIKFIKEPGVGHKVSLNGYQEATKWFEKHLL
ncbi:esterase [Oceanobacillus iheyensis]